MAATGYQPVAADDAVAARPAAAAATTNVALSIRSESRARIVALEVAGDGAWKRQTKNSVCPETWEARCWREEYKAGRLTPEEQTHWIAVVRNLAVQPAATPAPGVPSISIVVRSAGEVAAQATVPASEAESLAPLLALP